MKNIIIVLFLLTPFISFSQDKKFQLFWEQVKGILSETAYAGITLGNTWANGSGKLQDVPRFASAVEGHKSGILAAEVITGIDLSDHYLSFEGNFGEKISARSFSLSTGINYQDMIDFSITYTSSGKLGKGSMFDVSLVTSPLAIIRNEKANGFAIDGTVGLRAGFDGSYNYSLEDNGANAIIGAYIDDLRSFPNADTTKINFVRYHLEGEVDDKISGAKDLYGKRFLNLSIAGRVGYFGDSFDSYISPQIELQLNKKRAGISHRNVRIQFVARWFFLRGQKTFSVVEDRSYLTIYKIG